MRDALTALLLLLGTSIGCDEAACPRGSHKIPGPRCIANEEDGGAGDGGGEGGGESPRCGDGILDEGEECDEGPANDDEEPDECRTSCRLPSCGDGVTDRGEECDDGPGNEDDEPDACRLDCRRPSCGDGTVDSGESCDEGKDNRDDDPEGCRTNCALASCGNGQLDAGEACDDGDANDDSTADACRTTCVRAYCGDEVTDTGEECDEGDANDDDTADACRTTCVAALCGDGTIDAGEACDDGPDNSDAEADACRTNCVAASCGDDVVDAGETCDDGAGNSDADPDACRTACVRAGCGDGVVDTGENCDDENTVDSDGCDADCVTTRVVSLAAGKSHTCALLRSGEVRCWGVALYGQLGNGDAVNTVGDEPDEMPPPPVELGGRVQSIAAGDSHTCVLLEAGSVQCWGSAANGRLGNGDATDDIGDEPGELPVDVNVAPGQLVEAIACGGSHSCALLDDDSVRCWGAGGSGRLGYDDVEDIGDQGGEMPPEDVDVMGGEIAAHPVAIAAGSYHTCTILSRGAVRCWGSGAVGRIGYGNQTFGGNANLGDGPGDMPPGDLLLQDGGDSVDAISTRYEHTCAMIDGALRCWGYNVWGALGYENTEEIGNDAGEMPPDDVNVGANVVAVAAGLHFTCVVVEGGFVRCWGLNLHGQLGYGHSRNLGDGVGEMPAANVDIGGIVEAVVAGGQHTCALLDNGHVRCWGDGPRLGYEDPERIGDDESPAAAGDVPVF